MTTPWACLIKVLKRTHAHTGRLLVTEILLKLFYLLTFLACLAADTWVAFVSCELTRDSGFYAMLGYFFLIFAAYVATIFLQLALLNWAMPQCSRRCLCCSCDERRDTEEKQTSWEPCKETKLLLE